MDPPEPTDDLTGVAKDGLTLGDVDPRCFDVGAERLDSPYCCGEPCGVDVGQGQPGPLEASATASARPMPEPAPVMTATLSANAFTRLDAFRWVRAGRRSMAGGLRAAARLKSGGHPALSATRPGGRTWRVTRWLASLSLGPQRRVRYSK